MLVETKHAILRAILFADLHQYSRLMATNEAETVEFITHSFELFRKQCDEFAGEFIKSTGDGALLLFDSASVAIDFAMTLQARIRDAGKGVPPIGLFRIGLHMGEVLRRADDVYGHAINLAARVEAEALPGGVCITQEVYSAAHSSSRYGFRFAGRVALKNIPEPVSLYHVTEAEDSRHNDAVEHLLVFLIDGISLSTERGEPLLIRSLMAKAALGYLALSGRPGESLERLAALIWPERELLKARRALIDCIKTVERINASSLHDGVIRRGKFMGFPQSRTIIDLFRILEDLHRGKVDDLLLNRSDWPDAILRGLDRVSALFGAWLSVARHNWRDKICEALEANMERFEIVEPQIKRSATALLLLDPTHEPAAQRLIRHYAALGNAPAAMRVYDKLRMVLQERYSLTPNNATDELVNTINSNLKPTSEKSARQKRRARIPTVAVSAFQARSDVLIYPTSGFRSELIANLSKFRELAIVETQGGTPGPGVDYILAAECIEGTPDIRLFVTLVDAKSGRVVWSDSFMLSLSNWNDAQQRVISKVASSLEIYLSQDRLSRVLAGPIASLEAYDAWLRGENLLTRWSPADEDEAAKLFKWVIEEDPSFAPAYASLASVYNSRHFIRPGTLPDAADSRIALQLAARAVELDPLDSRNHLVSAWTTAMIGRFEQSEVHYELAAQLNPNNPKTLFSASNGLAFVGRKEEAVRLMDHAMSLTPQIQEHQWSYIATIRYFAEDFEGSVQAAKLSNNCIIDTLGWKAAALLQLGRREEARVAFSELCDLISAAWEGSVVASPSVVLAWFMSASPIRREEDKKGLMELGEFCH